MTFLSFFNRKLHRSIHARDDVLDKLKKQKLKINRYCMTVMLHCSSMGEYKQILPIAKKLRKSKNADYNIILSLFSTSVYEHIDKKNKLFDIVSYIPFDFYFRTKKFINIINPDVVLISKHDVWPNFLWELKRREIPVYLINALFADDTKMDKWYARFFFRSIFRSFTGVITVNEKHRQRFLNIYPYPDKLYISGDSRYDTVIYESENRESQDEMEEFEKLKECSKIFIAGSSWPPGENIIMSTWADIKRKFNDSFLILVPHEVNIDHIYKIQALCQEYKLNTKVYSEILPKEDILKYDILIIDQIGLLSRLYKFGSISYVGGGFSRYGLHSVLEPAVYGLPVLFGPNLDKSPEAQEMNRSNCGLIFQDKKELYKIIDSLWSDANLLKKVSDISRKFILGNSGASNRILDIVIDKGSNPKLDKEQTLTEEEFEEMLKSDRNF